MTSAGYLGILRRNSRKKDKPSMWRHCLRVYARMGELEAAEGSAGLSSSLSSPSSSDGEREVPTVGGKEKRIPGVGSYLSNLSSRSLYSGDSIFPEEGEQARARRRKIRRTSAHHEAALVATSKLGMWEEALRIYRSVDGSLSSGAASTVGEGSKVTDNMILSVIGACVRASNAKYAAANVTLVGDAPPGNADCEEIADDNRDGDSAFCISTTTRTPFSSNSCPTIRALTVEERRKPLDEARLIVLSMEERHDIPIVAHQVNPLASAYNRLGLRAEASALINVLLKDRAPPSPTPPARLTVRSERWRKNREPSMSDSNPGFEAVQLADWSDDDLDGDNNDGGIKNADADDEYDMSTREGWMTIAKTKRMAQQETGWQ